MMQYKKRLYFRFAQKLGPDSSDVESLVGWNYGDG